MVALLVPVLQALGRRQPYPWVADTFLSVIGFSDLLGNRLDLYDRVVWFDDVIHFVNTALLSAAVVLLTVPRASSALDVFDRALAAGLTAALGWELWEYATFVPSSPESDAAYADTVGDVVLGWAGAVSAAAVLVALRRRSGADRGR